ncbi:MAG: hypothetical protein ACXU98_06115, partial [Syntrophales bacterium]
AYSTLFYKDIETSRCKVIHLKPSQKPFVYISALTSPGSRHAPSSRLIDFTYNSSPRYKI